MPSPDVDPAWQAARNGLPADTTAVSHAAQVAQFLATHGIAVVCQGARQWTVASTTSGTGTPFIWIEPGMVPGGVGWLPQYDVDQPFTMPSGMTATGRVEVAVQAIGSGADLQVMLCPDNGSGDPVTGSPIASTVIPASHVLALSAAGSLASATPLATAQSNAALIGSNVTSAWSQPAVSINGAGDFACPVTSGNWTLFIAGYDTIASAGVGTVASVQYLGAGAVSGAIPQPALPQPGYYQCAAATPDTLAVAGGTSGISDGHGGSIGYSNVWTAAWDPSSGTLGSWAAQQALPATVVNGAMAAQGETLYVAAGSTDGLAANASASTWWATVASGQVASWTSGPSLPQAVIKPYLAVVGDWLICAGGVSTSGTALTATWYAAIAASGAPGPWQAGPPLPCPAYAFSPNWDLIATDSAMIIVSGATTGGAASTCTQSLAVSPDGPAPEWQLLDYSLTPFTSGTYQVAAYPSGTPGQWEAVGFLAASYTSAPLYPVPVISVPLPATGLTPGGTYHVVFRQLGGDSGLNDYLQLGELGAPNPPGPWLYSTRGSGGPWTSHANRAVCMSIYDQTAGGPPWHLWEDEGDRVTTLVWSGAGGQLLGVLEATQFPGGSPEAVTGPVTQVTWDGTGTIPAGTVQLA